MGRLFLRLVIGGVFLGHAAQKLLGWFGGPGIDGAAKGFETMGLRPGKRNVVAAGAAEAAGGTMIAAGLATPLGAALLGATMFEAIKHAHGKNGFWNAKGGYEYNLALAAAALALAEMGPGRLSLDAARGHERRGTRWALVALAAGLAGAAAADRASRPA